MAKAAPKVTLFPSPDIPFGKLMLSQSNVRRIKAGVSVEELAEDIARGGLLQSLSVRQFKMPKALRPGCSRSRPAAVALGEAKATGEDGASPLLCAGCFVGDPRRG